MGFFDDLRIFGMPKPPRIRTPHEIKVRREQGVAGSYNHIVTNNGNLIRNEPPYGAPFSDMIENLGDAYEAIEEMFGMIWWLGAELVNQGQIEKIAVEEDPTQRFEEIKAVVEKARENYKEGLEFSQEIHRLSPDQRRS